MWWSAAVSEPYSTNMDLHCFFIKSFCNAAVFAFDLQFILHDLNPNCSVYSTVVFLFSFLNHSK